MLCTGSALNSAHRYEGWAEQPDPEEAEAVERLREETERRLRERR